MIPPKSEGEALVISDSSYAGAKFPRVNATAHARTDPNRFELQAKKCPRRISISEETHKALHDLIKAIRARNPEHPVKFHLKHNYSADQMPETILDDAPSCDSGG